MQIEPLLGLIRCSIVDVVWRFWFSFQLSFGFNLLIVTAPTAASSCAIPDNGLSLSGRQHMWKLFLCAQYTNAAISDLASVSALPERPILAVDDHHHRLQANRRLHYHRGPFPGILRCVEVVGSLATNLSIANVEQHRFHPKHRRTVGPARVLGRHLDPDGRRVGNVSAQRHLLPHNAPIVAADEARGDDAAAAAAAAAFLLITLHDDGIVGVAFHLPRHARVELPPAPHPVLAAGIGDEISRSRFPTGGGGRIGIAPRAAVHLFIFDAGTVGMPILPGGLGMGTGLAAGTGLGLQPWPISSTATTTCHELSVLRVAVIAKVDVAVAHKAGGIAAVATLVDVVAAVPGGIAAREPRRLRPAGRAEAVGLSRGKLLVIAVRGICRCAAFIGIGIGILIRTAGRGGSRDAVDGPAEIRILARRAQVERIRPPPLLHQLLHRAGIIGGIGIAAAIAIRLRLGRGLGPPRGPIIPQLLSDELIDPSPQRINSSRQVPQGGMVGVPAALGAATSGEEEAAAGLGLGVPELVRQAGVVVRVAAREWEDDAGFVVVRGCGRPGRAVEGAEANGAVLRRLCRLCRRRHPDECNVFAGVLWLQYLTTAFLTNKSQNEAGGAARAPRYPE